MSIVSDKPNNRERLILLEKMLLSTEPPNMLRWNLKIAISIQHFLQKKQSIFGKWFLAFSGEKQY